MLKQIFLFPKYFDQGEERRQFSDWECYYSIKFFKQTNKIFSRQEKVLKLLGKKTN